MNKVIIAGGRDLPITDYVINRAKKALNSLKGDIELVSGCAKGADQIPFKLKSSYNVKSFPADWETFGKGAGHIRNEEMAKYATHLILFWDGKSKGSKNMLENAKKYNLKIKTIGYKQVRNTSS